MTYSVAPLSIILERKKWFRKNRHGVALCDVKNLIVSMCVLTGYALRSSSFARRIENKKSGKNEFIN